MTPSAQVADSSAQAEGHSPLEPGTGSETSPVGQQQVIQQQFQIQRQYQPLHRSTLPATSDMEGAHSATQDKSAKAAKGAISKISSCFSYFNPLRGLCGRALSYLTAQAVILAVVNGTIISFSSPLTAVPVICAVVDELWARNDPKTQSIVLESLVTAMLAASSYAMLKPFKEHMVKVIPSLVSASDSVLGISGAEVDYSTAVHLGAGVLAYTSYRMNHAAHRFLYRA